MSNIANLKRQHVEILDSINSIKALTKKNSIENNAAEIAKDISMMAGKLKIHLDTEDKFLYPDLLNGEDIKLKALANNYIKEMGDICSTFTEYKNKFNTKSKILSNIFEFDKETKAIFDAIEKRINKEDTELYIKLI